MKISANPRLLELLAASYALGTLRAGARRRFEALAREQAPVRAAALVWQGRLASMAELQPAVTPDPAVWVRIQNEIDGQRQQLAIQRQRETPVPPASTPTGWWRNLPLWRSAATAGALATVIAVAVGVRLDHQLREAPVVQYVAVLSDDKSAPSMLVTFDPKNRQLVLQRVGDYREGEDKSLQLWALPPGGAAPRSLGVIDKAPVLKLTASESQVREVPALAISLEPRGGVPSERGPTGPVLFKGALIEKAL
ncbi:anti-sigma factor [Variovorax sp. J22R133]|uniref:anti-sigma factor n=1 Tax=Variovorax brevis TaxID=3053503 RepID=UPI002578B50D|nr:anti-sigma factor [Variovorax sp. J22R133]MDM0112015.1 anti-sigma factor [Variovorax sp. J22R133]